VGEHWEATAPDTVVFSTYSTLEPEPSPSHTYIIKDNFIEDTQHGTTDVVMHLTRYIDIGESYVSQEVPNPLPTLDSSTFSCEVVEHLESLDLAVVTHSIAEGVYQDVLHLHCVLTGFQNGTSVPLGDNDSYHSKDTGLILGTDNIGLLSGGPAWIIPLRDWTIYNGASAFVPDQTDTDNPTDPTDPVPGDTISIPASEVYGHRLIASGAADNPYGMTSLSVEVDCNGTGVYTGVHNTNGEFSVVFDRVEINNNVVKFYWTDEGEEIYIDVYPDADSNLTTSVSRFINPDSGLLVNNIEQLQVCPAAM
jgi:hypothetical protein